jgi:hypothetical protein
MRYTQYLIKLVAVAALLVKCSGTSIDDLYNGSFLDEPYIQQILVQSGSLVQVNFDDEMASDGITKISNYTIKKNSDDTSLNIISATAISGSNNKLIQIKTDAQGQLTDYTLTARNLTSSLGKKMGDTGSSLSFRSLDIASPGIKITPSTLSVNESGTTAIASIVLNTQPTANVSIPFSSSNTADGTISSSNLVFTAANWNVPQNITITGVNDDVDDGDTTFNLVSGAATSTDTDYNGLDAFDMPITNVDNDTSAFTVSAVTGGGITTEAGANQTFTIALASKPSANVVITLTSSNEAEGRISRTGGVCNNSATVATGACTVTFTSANWNVAQTIRVTGIDDLPIDGNIAYTVTGTVTSADSIYNALTFSNVSLTNNDNDTAGVNFSKTVSLVTKEDGTFENTTVTLNSIPSSNVTLTFSSTDTTEGQINQAAGTCSSAGGIAASSCTMVLTPANYSTGIVLRITGVADADTTAQNYSIATTVSSADSNYNGISVSNLNLVNADPASKRIFLTTSTYNGNLGGVSGADAKCAADSNKPASGTYKALIVQNGVRVACTTANCSTGSIEHTDWVLLPLTLYTRVDGTTNIFTTNSDGIFVVSTGGTLTNSIATGFSQIWTGLTADYQISAVHSSFGNKDTCGNWNYSGFSQPYGTYGFAHNTDATFIYQSFGGCDQSFTIKLACVEQ